MSGEPREELTTEEYAAIAARVAVHTNLPRAEVLAPYGFSEAEWEATVEKWTQRIVDEVRARAGSDVPIQDRYPLAAGYAKAYALAVKEARKELVVSDDEATVRIAPGTPPEQPLSVLIASNRAAARR
jgi:hypothetical protein